MRSLVDQVPRGGVAGAQVAGDADVVAADDIDEYMQRAGLFLDLGDGGVPLVLIDDVGVTAGRR